VTVEVEIDGIQEATASNALMRLLFQWVFLDLGNAKSESEGLLALEKDLGNCMAAGTIDLDRYIGKDAGAMRQLSESFHAVALKLFQRQLGYAEMPDAWHVGAIYDAMRIWDSLRHKARRIKPGSVQ